jgi:hypothetical protein
MALLLVALVVLLLTFGGADRLAAWLLPTLPPDVGAIALIVCLILVTALVLPPTRLLANAAIIGMGAACVALGRALVSACISALRTIWDLGRSAFRSLRGHP